MARLVSRLVPIERRWNHNFHYHDLVLAAMPVPCSAALDVGSGEGTLVAKLAARSEHVTGIDLAQRVDELVHAAAPRAEWIADNFYTYDFGPRKFDLVACVATLHHLEMCLAMRKMAALLVPGGKLVVVGLAASGTARDAAYDAMGLAKSRLERALRGFYRADVAQSDCRITYDEVAQTLGSLLPGGEFKRLVLFRYAYTWTKPTTGD
jgi:2-polyprenyl-3-methyl-5-hydroxy-6-metoxy-1,4-benzoquinol methylase